MDETLKIFRQNLILSIQEFMLKCDSNTNVENLKFFVEKENDLFFKFITEIFKSFITLF